MVVDEKELIRYLENGDVRAMKMVFDGYYRALSIYAIRYVTVLEDAEDLVQEVLISFWQNKKGSAFTGSIKAYLFGAVQKASATFLKKRGRQLFIDIEDYPEFSIYETELYEDDEVLRRRKQIEQSIEALPEKCREVFCCIVLGNMKYKEAAEKLGVSVNTVKTHYVSALRRLRDQLNVCILYLLSMRVKGNNHSF